MASSASSATLSPGETLTFRQGEETSLLSQIVRLKRQNKDGYIYFQIKSLSAQAEQGYQLTVIGKDGWIERARSGNISAYSKKLEWIVEKKVLSSRNESAQITITEDSNETFQAIFDRSAFAGSSLPFLPHLSSAMTTLESPPPSLPSQLGDEIGEEISSGEQEYRNKETHLREQETVLLQACRKLETELQPLDKRVVELSTSLSQDREKYAVANQQFEASNSEVIRIRIAREELPKDIQQLERELSTTEKKKDCYERVQFIATSYAQLRGQLDTLSTGYQTAVQAKNKKEAKRLLDEFNGAKEHSMKEIHRLIEEFAEKDLYLTHSFQDYIAKGDSLSIDGKSQENAPAEGLIEFNRYVTELGATVDGLTGKVSDIRRRLEEKRSELAIVSEQVLKAAESRNDEMLERRNGFSDAIRCQESELESIQEQQSEKRSDLEKNTRAIGDIKRELTNHFREMKESDWYRQKQRDVQERHRALTGASASGRPSEPLTPPPSAPSRVDAAAVDVPEPAREDHLTTPLLGSGTKQSLPWYTRFKNWLISIFCCCFGRSKVEE